MARTERQLERDARRLKGRHTDRQTLKRRLALELSLGGHCPGSISRCGRDALRGRDSPLKFEYAVATGTGFVLMGCCAATGR